VTPPSPLKSTGTALPIGVLLIDLMSTQCGAALAKGLFPAVGAIGTAALRLALGSVVMMVAFRAWRLRSSARIMRSIVLYGLAMGTMNTCFYLALTHIPLGITVALEFLGPLAVALLASHRALDVLWVALAGIGVWALMPLGAGGAALSAAGIAYALAAGVCWALYIVFGQRTAGAHAGQSAALGTLAGAVLIVPIGFAEAGRALLEVERLPLAMAVALLSTALPYTLEMFALTRLPARTYGVLMSMAPALGALSGLAFLGEHLTVVQWLAIASIVLASGGVAATSSAAVPVRELPE
jgi:inner membrane transporter RhtA